MSVRLDSETIRLEGDCHVEDAERLAALLEADRDRKVDLSACGHLHSAVVQALVVFRPPLVGEPAEGFLRDLLLPALRSRAP